MAVLALLPLPYRETLYCPKTGGREAGANWSENPLGSAIPIPDTGTFVRMDINDRAVISPIFKRFKRFGDFP